MNFGVIEPLLEKGDVVLWEIRGMGVSQKMGHYRSDSLLATEEFFLETVIVLLAHFNPSACIFICHSFSAYLVLRFLIKFPGLTHRHIKEVVLLSPVGITPK